MLAADLLLQLASYLADGAAQTLDGNHRIHHGQVHAQSSLARPDIRLHQVIRPLTGGIARRVKDGASLSPSEVVDQDLCTAGQCSLPLRVCVSQCLISAPVRGCAVLVEGAHFRCGTRSMRWIIQREAYRRDGGKPPEGSPKGMIEGASVAFDVHSPAPRVRANCPSHRDGHQPCHQVLNVHTHHFGRNALQNLRGLSVNAHFDLAHVIRTPLERVLDGPWQCSQFTPVLGILSCCGVSIAQFLQAQILEARLLRENPAPRERMPQIVFQNHPTGAIDHRVMCNGLGVPIHAPEHHATTSSDIDVIDQCIHVQSPHNHRTVSLGTNKVRERRTGVHARTKHRMCLRYLLQSPLQVLHSDRPQIQAARLHKAVAHSSFHLPAQHRRDGESPRDFRVPLLRPSFCLALCCFPSTRLTVLRRDPLGNLAWRAPQKEVPRSHVEISARQRMSNADGKNTVST